jgi:pyruvate-ferredoxin/flavodoxin oxidoreductase
MKSFPEEAKELFVVAESNAKWRYKSYQRMAAMDFTPSEK